MNRTVSDNRAVYLEGKQIANDLQPRPPRSCLVFTLARSVHKIDLRLLHQNPPHQSPMKQSVPFNGKIHSLGGEERDRNVANRLADADIVDRIGAAPEVNLNISDL